ncbi:radical SAM family heme chaperone HemW [Bifidobacterium mongoliense]|uniref:radical SAM family heme chaperone HemW n=1 Tax=Bifidobacterium mongoliense TaxID=518643 RepID=UPI0030F461F3
MYEVYIHVPFCLRRCGYCDFNTYTASDLGGGASRDHYAAMAIREMRLVKQWQINHGITEPAASTLFFGGGTPTVLPPASLGAMLRAVDELWGLAPGAEVTTEANTDTVDHDSIAALRDLGFNRISFGMQSAVPRVLKTLDRTHTPANVTQGVKAAAQVGLRSSVDLIYGTPGEDMGDWRYSVQTALDLGVDHISAYALTLEPTTAMGRAVAHGTMPGPDDDDEAAKYALADAMFTEAGLHWYEISNWARPGYESRHNLGYWRNVDWAGIGPGAHSHYNGVGHGQDVRSWDIAHPKRWAQAIDRRDVPWQGSERIDAFEHAEELIMLGVRLREGLDCTRVERAVARIPGYKGAKTIEGERGPHADPIDDLVAEGLIEVHGTRIIPTLRGRLLNDALIERLYEAYGL